MKSYPKKWGKLFERYLDEYLPERKDEICARADREYRKLLTQMPDVGGKENMMASNMETWFSIVAFYEASDHVIDGKAFETIYEWHIDPLRFLGKIIDANRSKWVYKLFGIIYDRYEKQLREHQAKGEWKDSWGIAVNPENHKEGYSFHLIGCPIAKHAKENGYEELLPHLCRTDHVLAEVLFACEGDKEVGFALFFHNFSTFLGRAGIYLEDLFVLPEYRGKGYGKPLLKKLAQITVERGCGRLEWACLDWNQPSIDFYRSLGAVPMDEWTTYRLTGDTLLEMAK